MIIIKEPHNHKEASGNVTIIEEVSQSGSGSVFAPGRFGPGRFAPWLFGQDISPRHFGPVTPPFWTRTFRPLTFWTWTFRPPPPDILDQEVSPRTFWTWTFRAHDVSPRTFWAWTFRSRTFRTWSFRPLTFLVQDVLPPKILDQEVLRNFKHRVVHNRKLILLLLFFAVHPRWPSRASWLLILIGVG